MEIHRIQRDKRKHLDLLLLADEQEEMIERYLDRGALFLLTHAGNKVAFFVIAYYNRQM